MKLRYSLKNDWVFYLLILSYGFLVARLTYTLWFGGGINLFASYSDSVSSEQMIANANIIYWSKTSFLYLTLLLFSLNFDYRFAVGVGCSFWAISLLVIFGVKPLLIVATIIGLALIAIQLVRKEVWNKS